MLVSLLDRKLPLANVTISKRNSFCKVAEGATENVSRPKILQNLAWLVVKHSELPTTNKQYSSSL